MERSLSIVDYFSINVDAHNLKNDPFSLSFFNSFLPQIIIYYSKNNITVVCNKSNHKSALHNQFYCKECNVIF